MAALPPVTDKLAEFVHRTEFSAIPQQTRINAKLHILDTLGVALAAVDQPAAHAVPRQFASHGQSDRAGADDQNRVVRDIGCHVFPHAGGKSAGRRARPGGTFLHSICACNPA